MKERGAFDGAFYSGRCHTVLRSGCSSIRSDECWCGRLRCVWDDAGPVAHGGDEHGGSIVVMSPRPRCAGAGACRYCAAKGRWTPWFGVPRSNCAPRKIRVNSLRAAAVDTPLHTLHGIDRAGSDP